MDTQTNNMKTKLSAIDIALAVAKARKATKESLDHTAGEASSKTKKPKVETAQGFAKAQKTEALKAAREAARAVRAAERDERRAAKVLARGQAKTPHMKKIEKAASSLPSMNDSTTCTFNEVTTNFSAEQINALALHLQHFNRVRATERALNQKLEVGQQVRIIGGPTKHVGKLATVDRAQRIRCFVNIPGVNKPVYLFTSDVELVAAMQATGTEG